MIHANVFRTIYKTYITIKSSKILPHVWHEEKRFDLFIICRSPRGIVLTASPAVNSQRARPEFGLDAMADLGRRNKKIGLGNSDLLEVNMCFFHFF